MWRSTILGLGIVAAALSGGAVRAADDFPSQPIKVVVPFSPGGTSDLAARFFGEAMAKELGQPVVVENRPGGNGAVAIARVRTSPADGYTVLLGSNSLMAVNPVVVKDLPYDPVTELKPVSGLTRGMLVIAVQPDSPIRTLNDLVRTARERQGALTVGTTAPGYQLAMEWLGKLADFRFVNTSYKGVGPATADLMGGHVDLAYIDMSGVAALLKSGKLRAIAVSGEQRHPDFPDVPTIREGGFPEYATYLWVSFFVHADTPADRVGKLARVLGKSLADDSARAFAARTSGDLLPFGPDEMRRFQISEIERFRGIARAAGFQPQ